MLRVEIHDSADSLSLKLEGRFTGVDAENTRTLITRCREGMRLVVDLTDVTFIDSVGEEALSFFGRFGTEFVAQTSYTLDICERLHLRPCSRCGIEYEHIRRFPHKRSPTHGPCTSVGKRGSLKTSRQARCDFPRFHPEFCGIRAAVSRPAVYRSFVLTEEVLE